MRAKSAEAVVSAGSGICPGITLTRGAGSRPGPGSAHAPLVTDFGSHDDGGYGKAAADAHGPSKAAAAMETAATAMEATAVMAAANGSSLVAEPA